MSRPLSLSVSLMFFALWLLLPLQGSGQPHSLLIFPAPAELDLTEGDFDWQRRLALDLPEEMRAEAGLIASLLGLEPLRGDAPAEAVIHYRLDRGDALQTEAYQLTIEPDRISILGGSERALMYATQTLVQSQSKESQRRTSPCLRIADAPRFAYRGMHLDVCRHFFPVSFVKRYLDLMARYKFNTFHWHLTEDQGWRIEIKRYPRLTEVGAWRSGSQIGPYARQAFDSIPHGGYYTQDDIREVVAYAASLGITVMPEIEMPGHALAALASYPELSCTGGPFEVARGWGVFDDVFCTREETLIFLEHVLEEVLTLFPSTYIHIGGDECPKTRWKQCTHCQTRIREEGLKDEHELQSWFIRRIERFLNSRGRKLIGWDEILEGGLAPNATVMSWRGTEGGIDAARAGHDAVMTPGSHCYFDHYQGDPAYEPHAIGGFTPLQKVYAYEPVPAALQGVEIKHILGAQGNVWTEYMRDSQHVFYMILPRMIALSEVLWTPAAQKDEAAFLRRLDGELPRLDALGYPYARSLQQVQIVPSRGNRPGSIEVIARPSLADSPVQLRWSSDYGLTGDSILSRLTIRENTRVQAQLAGVAGAPVSHRAFRFNKATAQDIRALPEPHEQYRMGGVFTLVDGIQAGDRRISTEWLGWQSSVHLLLDLGTIQPIEQITIGTFHEPHSWIHRPDLVVFEVSSDGEVYHTLESVDTEASWDALNIGGRVTYRTSQPTKARYVRIQVRSRGTIPEGFAGAGHPAWLFLDELEVH